MKRRDVYLWSFAAIIISLFIFSSYLTKEGQEFFERFADNGLKGMIVYVIIIILEIVFAPISIVPLIPVATGIWGPFLSGVLVLIGWTAGSIIAFGIARRGVPLFEKRYAFKKIRKIEEIIPEQNIFLGIVLLRITLPFDILSYAIGFLSRVSWKTYSAATFVGFIPLAFVLAYLGAISPIYQAVLLVLGLIFFAIFIRKYHRDASFKNKIIRKWEKKFKK